MKYSELVILLPCHSLDDFPTYHDGDDAEGLLACWSSLWHPALLASAEKLPSWYRADSPPDALQDRLVVVPSVSDSQLLAGWGTRAQNEGATVVRKTSKRSEILAQALEPLDGGDGGVDPDLAADFLAFGTGYLILELLVRHQRHYSNLDEVHIKTQVVAGAHAALAGDAETARRCLKSCCETLLEAREQCYPAELYLLDLTLLADTALAGVAEELKQPRKSNFLASGSVIERLAAENPSALQALRTAWEAGEAAVIGGEYTEQDLPLGDHERILASLSAGQAAYETHLGRTPSVYGRRRNGLGPLVPQVLQGLGYRGGLAYTLDDGHFPSIGQSLVEWEGLDGSLLYAIARIPLDADLPESFLKIPEKLGDAMDHDQIASLTFAHWPGQARDWYEDIARVSRFEPVFGTFVTAEAFLDLSSSAAHTGQGLPDEYRTPYLKQAIIRRRDEPTHRYRNAIQQSMTLQAAETLSVLSDTLARLGDVDHKPNASAHDALAEQRRRVMAHASPLVDTPDDIPEADGEGVLSDAASELARTLGAKPEAKGKSALVFNPLPFARRIGVELPIAPPAVTEMVRASQATSGGSHVVVDVPAFGFAKLDPAAKDNNPRLPKPLVEQNLLRNEFFEVAIDPTTGGIRTLHDYTTRSNRFSYQIAYRVPGPKPRAGDTWQDPDLSAVYSKMRAKSSKITANGPALGEITTTGELLDREERVLAKFTQRYQCWRASRVLVLDLELDILEPPRADPWNCYYAARFAWSDESAQLYRSVGQERVPTEAKRLEAPLFIEAVNGDLRTLMLTGGAPFTKKIGFRSLDTILVCKGDTRNRFRMGIGLEVPYPTNAALDLLGPAPVVPIAATNGLGASGWFFHVDRKNVLVTHWELLTESDPVAGDSIVGLRARLLETEGRGGPVSLRLPQTPSFAERTNLAGEAVKSLEISGDAVTLEIGPREFIQVEARW